MDDEDVPEDSRYRMRNDALRRLSAKKIILDQRFVTVLAEIIREPMSIEDTHSFSILIGKSGEGQFIAPLIDSISTAVPGTSRWLADYMYALIELLMERDDYYPVSDDFAHLMGRWLLTTGGGEISWKSGSVLSGVANSETRDYLMRGVKDGNLFSMTRIACMRGIVNHYRKDAKQVLLDVADDPDPEVRAATASAMAHIKKGDSREQEN